MKVEILVILGERDEFATRWTDIGYWSAILRHGGYDVNVSLIDKQAVVMACELYKNLREDDILCVVLCQNNGIYLDEFFGQIRKKAKIIMLGLEATFYSRSLLERYNVIDYVMLGECEYSLLDLIKHLEKKESIDECRGVCYRKDGKIFYLPPNEFVCELDTLPFPDRTFLPKEFTRFNVMGSRGCAGHCTFCVSNILYDFYGKRKVRFRSIDNILDEIEMLLANYNCQYIYFEDSTFDDGGERLEELYIKMTDRNLSVPFFINIRAEFINDTSIKKIIKLKEVGLDAIFIGLDAGNEEDLRLYGKIATVEGNKKAILVLRKYGIIDGKQGITFNYGFINFNPYTTVERLKENICFFKETGLPVKISALSNRLRISGWTPLVKKMKADNLLTEDPYNSLIDVYSYNFENMEVERIYEEFNYFKRKINTQYYMDIQSLYNQYRRKYDSVPKEFEEWYEELFVFRLRVGEIALEAMELIISCVEKNEVNIYKEIDALLEKNSDYLEYYDAKMRGFKLKLAKILLVDKKIIV